MDDRTLHDLAVAYAQVKLLRYQEEKQNSINLETDSEISFFLKSYLFAKERIRDLGPETDPGDMY